MGKDKPRKSTSTKKTTVATTASEGSTAPVATPAKRAGDGAKPESVRSLVTTTVVLFVVAMALREAYRIRLYAIITYGRIIHEFDPWFNMRATQYLADHGAHAFFHWYDYESWYPLGRPVGTTIYPGMQFTAVAIWRILGWVAGHFSKLSGLAMSLNDVCVFIPAWFGALASALLGLLTMEVSGGNLWAGVAGTCVMAVIPAHLMRSVGGAYDNESVAISAMCLTFWLWCRSLRTARSWWIGALAGLAYGYMVAAWGGFVFVGNMVGIHAAFLVFSGKYSPSLHLAYTLYYAIGTFCATRVPVVGMSPFQSMEQLGPLCVFVGMHVFAAVRVLSYKKLQLTWKENRNTILFLYALAGMVFIIMPVYILHALGYFRPASARVSSLFVKHTRTGNPLVDSVAEHQPASSEAYWYFLHYPYYLMPIGFMIAASLGMDLKPTAKLEEFESGVSLSKYFIMLYAVIAYYFANRMTRLIILMGPVASALSGIAIGFGVQWCFGQFSEVIHRFVLDPKVEHKEQEKPVEKVEKKSKMSKKKGSKASEATSASTVDNAVIRFLEHYEITPLVPVAREVTSTYRSPFMLILRAVFAVMILFAALVRAKHFWNYCDQYSLSSSHPSLMFQARLNDGSNVIINDYMEAYWWLRDSTPQDSRVLSWWDYGYQISGIGNRTTLADGNTWNLEHIATVGLMLASNETYSHKLARHVADYVLIWAGNPQSDDLAKSPHIARIANSVYADVCPQGDTLCHHFGFMQDGTPTPSMANSLLYKMHEHGNHGVQVDPKLFREAYRTKYGLVRIFEVLNISRKSKRWAADPANRICDAPGSWYCTGQYPPEFLKHVPKGSVPQTHRHITYN
ncbi:Dolichyl-diphosphooligosaccharide--protein glycosyltransferase subunit stt3 [Pelomyxa schiedti]|nr:Dolichyl-diphosphooligosaccharide--protein glycosyltransferase subunit stt3 [Pelomyxa schiedti]